jgi:tRNA dimethylallyltransferase
MSLRREVLIAIVGPTAVGKSHFAICLAKEFSGEIVNADSRQIYRYMDIGTAKPGKDEFARVPHHLFDIMSPDENFSLADYRELAFRTIRDIQARGKVPFLAGGSGQYVWAIIENWQIPRVPPDPDIRKKLDKKAAEESGGEALYRELEQIDPESATHIGHFNTRRIIRALEVYYTCGIPLSKLQTKGEPLFDTLIIGLTEDRQKLYAKIDRRVDEMVKCGLAQEVENLSKIGYDLSLPAMSAIGYKQIGLYLKGEVDLDTAVSRVKFETHRYVRQQYNWFHLKDARIRWFDVDKNPYEEIKAAVAGFLNKRRDNG